MQYRKLGNTDMEVSAVAFGCWAIAGGFNWGPQEERNSIAALRAAYESGVTFFDTAEGYGDGLSEQLLGKALGDVRDRIVIATKASPSHLEPDALRSACERSLKNLATERIDLYQIHWPSRDVPLEPTMATLAQLKAEGKIRHIGVSNFGVEALSECLKYGEVVSDQMAYNLLFRAIEHEILPFCAARGIPILCYSPIMQGLLTGKFRSAEDVPQERARMRHFSRSRPLTRHGEEGAEEGTFRAIHEVDGLAGEIGVPMEQLALAWLLARPGVGAVLAGGRTAEQARRNALAADLKLPDETVRRLTQITEPLKSRLGTNPDMWQSQSRVW